MAKKWGKKPAPERYRPEMLEDREAFLQRYPLALALGPPRARQPAWPPNLPVHRATQPPAGGTKKD